jgi:hypothetical protein
VPPIDNVTVFDEETFLSVSADPLISISVMAPQFSFPSSLFPLIVIFTYLAVFSSKLYLSDDRVFPLLVPS